MEQRLGRLHPFLSTNAWLAAGSNMTGRGSRVWGFLWLCTQSWSGTPSPGTAPLPWPMLAKWNLGPAGTRASQTGASVSPL